MSSNSNQAKVVTAVAAVGVVAAVAVYFFKSRKSQKKSEAPKEEEKPKQEFPGKVEGKVEFPGKVEGEKKAFPGKVEGKVEFPGKVEGKKEFPGKVEGKVEFPGKVEGKKEFPGKVEGEKKEFPGKVEGKVEFPGKVEGEKKEFPGKVEGKVEFPGKVEGKKEFPGKVEGKVEFPGKVEGEKKEFPGKVEGEKKEFPGKVEGNKKEFPGKVEGKKEFPGKVEGKVEFPGKVEGDKKEFPGKVEGDKKEFPGKVEGKKEFPGKVEGEKEFPGKVEGKVEFPGKVEGKKEFPGKVEGKVEFPGKVEGKKEFPGKVEGEKKEFPGKVEGKVEFPGKVESKAEPKAEEKAPAKKPAEFVTFYNEAKRQFNNQEYEAALGNFNKAIDAIPKNNAQLKTLIYSRGSCLKKLNRLEEAIADYTQCITLDDKYSRAYKARAGVYKSLDRLEEAIEDFSYCYLLDTVSSGDMQMTPEGMDEVIQALAKRDAKAELARRHADKEYKRHLPSKQFVAFYFSTIASEKAAEYNPSKFTEQQLAELIAAPQGDATVGDYLLMRGGLRKAEQRYEEAMADFLEAAKEESHCHAQADACLEAATFLSLSGDTIEALKYYERVYADKAQRSVNLLVKYASCLVEQEDERYRAIFDEACASFPGECDGFFHRGQVMYIENKTEEAIRDLTKVTELNKNHAMAHVQLAFCYMNQNQSQQAMESMKRAVACGKNRAQVFNHFGELCMALGLFSDADMNFKKAEEADKDWAYSYVNEATYYLQTTQDYLKASDLLKKAIKIDPSCINAYLQLAQLHMLLQEWDDANSILDSALKEAVSYSDITSVYTSKESSTYQLKTLQKYQTSLKAAK